MGRSHRPTLSVLPDGHDAAVDCNYGTGATEAFVKLLFLSLASP
jgi:hypothetical protein